MTPLGLVAMIVDSVFKGTALLLVAFMVARALLNAPAAIEASRSGATWQWSARWPSPSRYAC